MLVSLHVKNLALIEEAETFFSKGLNILSGETGAGKSIIIGSITLALGAKADSNLIRNGAEYALIELVFQTQEKKILSQMNALELPVEDGTIILTRRIQSSRSVFKINGEIVTAKQVKSLAELLLNIHGQNEHQTLLHKEKYREILDDYAGIELKKLLSEHLENYKKMQNLKKEYQEMYADDAKRIREMELATFEFQEIESADLKKDEDIDLEKTYQFMLHSRKIAEAVSIVKSMLGTEDDTSVNNQIGRALREMRGVMGLDSNLEELEKQLEEIDSLMGDFEYSISNYLDSLEFDDAEYNGIEERLNLLNHLKSKYGNTVEAIVSYQMEKAEIIEKLRDYDTYQQKLQKQLDTLEEEMKKQCFTISSLRKKAALALASKLKQALIDLNFLHVAFEITVEQDTEHLTAKGFDKIEFMISTNPGEPLAPLHMVASGGELSRMMLALKTVLANQDDINTLIFDEIDTGISGKTAWKVSEKLGALSKGHQIICITHLPQIAAMADMHFYIEKSTDGSSTATSIKELSKENQIEELARMLGGDIVSTAAIENAKELIAKAQQSKK